MVPGYPPRVQGFKIRLSVMEEFGTWGPWSFYVVPTWCGLFVCRFGVQGLVDLGSQSLPGVQWYSVLVV